MKFVADFHIHSKYSRATSPLMNVDSLDNWARIKGIKIIGTGDFTHPAWLKELKEKLSPAERGLFKLKETDSPVRFILTSEISCIYSKLGKVRKIHIIVFAPSFEAVEKINAQLEKIGNLRADGRPILGLDAKELAKIVLSSDQNCMVVPAHIWTPWFSVFGSKSGFDSLEECFEDYTKYIYAVETGLSSDPAMNWRLSQLDKITLISNSDSHSAPKIGREANVFNADISYKAIFDALKSKDPKKFLYTIEFFPEEGKYHYDGHRLCNLSLSPEESKKYNNICPRCQKPLVIGVLNRVEELADRSKGFVPENAIPFKSLIPLQEVIADSIKKSVVSKEVAELYNGLIKNLGSEFDILLEKNRQDIQKNSLPEIAEGVLRVREGRVNIEPGYDGVYGKIKIFPENDGLVKNIKKSFSQKTLF
ncbi:MAG: DNA helicase UvrD [Candidatus Staskawiczbacteria bacterium RIFOXYC1_FULL_37_43]|nr:MAG: DNA helicase UvrD [Candidatus Staskawiczbacteria bacterium RIFCSPHIGHO2_01_FULL_37_17]OGZ72442.1 MAG: DNA helicase UvrD [Candidatus Staskawiczbacteria bacterium RIFCSPLOWO2_01_FULL_37_19]OGZ75930.1 MAG: DNA helicase UvrD [Candidatus Staskawiczbacteria bacterium RIFOXYA1_FULL_37_15]OGZ76903.1 MAG: DNA helicase UvrD [Candidatus Staskawiczbacteria bacterium RIFOXYA12_FULL_37_10]OGZ80819.1 MAG: DNA helicase UvrD [Candidatus Staskawiczbacteria bacterium RIFOXYB1_FULL_38_37]OGZ82574.1 MAG: D